MSKGFGADHLPYGIFSVDGSTPRVGVRIDDVIIDLSLELGRPEFAEPTLNALMSLGAHAWEQVRDEAIGLAGRADHLDTVPVGAATMQLPFTVADYVDFYASEQHALNVGKIFRPDNAALPAAWKHLPIGYHGRAGTVVVSGTDVRRPVGQGRPSAQDPDVPAYGPSRRLDIEAELGFVVGTPTVLGQTVAPADFADHVFGVTLLNDWSARDIQAWEYVPLGPFLGKSFATSISAWITPLAALESARVDLPGQVPAPLPHLAVTDPAGYAIDVEVVLNGEVVSRPPYAAMYWSPAQMLAHLTSNGASLRTGDLFASGTISGAEPAQRGSFLELSWGGTQPFGTDEHTFLRDGDEVILRATAPGPHGARTALGEVTGRILPSAT